MGLDRHGLLTNVQISGQKQVLLFRKEPECLMSDQVSVLNWLYPLSLYVFLHLISGSACRFKVVGWLKKRFTTPLEAEAHYSGSGSAIPPGPTELSLETLSSLFSRYCQDKLNLKISDNFLTCAAPAMSHLNDAGRRNILYDLAKGIATLRSDGSDYLFLLKRMPMGLVEYMAAFFISSDSRNVRCFGVYIYHLCVFRFLDVPVITECGLKRCTPTLGKSGPNYIMAQCGL